MPDNKKEITTVDEAGLAFIVKHEGCVLKPYLDSVNVPTIGIGCTYYENGRKVTMKDPAITKARAVDLFKNLLKGYELEVYSRTRDDINQSQFNALVSICFNIGRAGFAKSTLLRRVNNNPMDPTIKDAFLMWSRAGSDPDALEGRRMDEAKLYFSK